jgi:4-amino-4-deoxy-L-arabinose transferase-like glycosyltransferase
VTVGQPLAAPGRRPRWSGRLPATIGALALLGVTVTLLFFDFGVRVLATNDEARFPVLARDILANGHWLAPRLGDASYVNKPPLYAWLIALAAWPRGQVTQSSALWPSLLSAVGVSLTLAWIGWRLWGGAVGLSAGLIAVTTHGVFTLARAPMPDMTLCFVLTAAMAVFVAVEFEDRRRLMGFFYLLLGLGFWVKGVAALLGLAVVVVFAAWSAGRAGLRRLALPEGLVLLALLSVPWLVLRGTAGGARFWREAVVTDWLLWYVPLGPWQPRALVQPLAQALAVLLPWSLLLAPALAWTIGDDAPASQRRRVLVLAWIGATFLLVAVAREQRLRYYLPLCPPAALLIAAWAHHLRLRRRIALVAALLALVAAGAVGWQLVDDRRHNARTDLRALGPDTVPRRASLHAARVPELVLTFYLDRAVSAVRTPAALSPSSAGRDTSYVAVAHRALPHWAGACAAPAVGEGMVDGQRFSVLRLESSGCLDPEKKTTP